MLADFEITIHGEQERTVRVIVHNTTRALRAAATRMDRIYGLDTSDNSNTLGICHRFERRYSPDDSLCAVVRVAPPHVGIGVLAHELAHAAVWINQLNQGEVPLTDENDEPFCWVLGELIRQSVLKMYEHGVW